MRPAIAMIMVTTIMVTIMPMILATNAHTSSLLHMLHGDMKFMLTKNTTPIRQHPMSHCANVVTVDDACGLLH